jgi:uncharacterized lipoprotein NlpE involved in copper resistance
MSAMHSFGLRRNPPGGGCVRSRTCQVASSDGNQESNHNPATIRQPCCQSRTRSKVPTTIALGQAENPPASTKESKRTSGRGQTAAEQTTKSGTAPEKNKASSLTGWVKTEADKVVFVNDKDKQTWNVQNPDVLKPHDGQHVKVKATLNETDKSLTVNNVKELRKGKQSGEQQQPPK